MRLNRLHAILSGFLSADEALPSANPTKWRRVPPHRHTASAEPMIVLSPLRSVTYKGSQAMEKQSKPECVVEAHPEDPSCPDGPTDLLRPKRRRIDRITFDQPTKTIKLASGDSFPLCDADETVGTGFPRQ
jgi:hypothetical protein